MHTYKWNISGNVSYISDVSLVESIGEKAVGSTVQ